MRFLCVTLGLHPDVVGGAWRVAAEQAAGLAARGHSVEVITCQAETQLPPSEERQGVRILRIQRPAAGGFHTRWRAANRLTRELVRQRLDASHPPALVLQHHAYLAPATRGIQSPILQTFHGPWAEEFRLARQTGPTAPPRRWVNAVLARILHQVESRALRHARRILVLSHHFARNLSRWHPGVLPPVEVVPGGVDTRLFRPPDDRDALRAEWGLEPADRLLVATRRLDPRMGLNLLIEGFGRLAGEFPRAHLWLTGLGPAEDRLRTLAKQLGVADRVRFLGFLSEPDLAGLLGAADLALMPSLDLEGFGLATAEALACGTPVLGSRAGATPELLEPLDPGLLFNQGSVDALASCLRAALRAPDRMPARERCAAYARDRFSWDHQVAACEKAAAALLSLNSAP